MVDKEQESPEETPEILESELAAPAESRAISALNDDLLVIEGNNDVELELADNYGVFEQEEGMIAWSLQNFYREDGSIRNKRELKLDPAILRIEDASGGSVDFLLTQEFTKTLNDSLEKVHLATYGIQKSRKSFASFKESLINSAIANPVRTILLGVVILMVPLFLFVF